MPGQGRILWFDSLREFLDYERSIGDLWLEKSIGARVFADGYCGICERRTHFQVSTGAQFDGRPNLREGMRCRSCGMTARQRSVVSAFLDSFPDALRLRGLVMEKWSPVRAFIERRHPRTLSSEFLPGARKPGRSYTWWPGRRVWKAAMVRHESITGLSFEDGALDFLIHSDVLEHVEHYRLALRECARVLKSGAPMLMTVPFFTALDKGLLRGRTD